MLIIAHLGLFFLFVFPAGFQGYYRPERSVLSRDQAKLIQPDAARNLAQWLCHLPYLNLKTKQKKNPNNNAFLIVTVAQQFSCLHLFV